MAQRRNAQKILRLRRTVAPAIQAGTDETQPLRRTLWGVSESAARQLLEKQQQAQAAQRRQAGAEIDAARAELDRLTALVAQQKRRLQSLRNVVEVLRDKLAKERAARAVLAARLLDRQADDQRAAQSAAARMEAARLGADASREHDALRQLVAALYRSIAGRGPVPADLEVLSTIPADKAGPTTGGPLRPALTPQWHRFLTGKKAGQTLITPKGYTIVQEGETIGPENVAAAEEAGLLFELILAAKVPEQIPDL